MNKAVVLVSMITLALQAQEEFKPDYSMLASMVTMKYDEAIYVIEKQITMPSSSQEQEALKKACENLNNAKGIAQINHKFICSVLFKDLEMMKRFLKEGACIDAKTGNAESALICASSNEGTFEIAKYLVENHANMNAQCVRGFTALMCASCRGNTDIVKLLLENGADTELKDKKGKTALWWAENQNHAEVVKLLKEKANSASKDTESIREKPSSLEKPVGSQPFLFVIHETSGGVNDEKVPSSINAGSQSLARTVEWLGMRLMPVAAGTFQMGSDAGQAESKPVPVHTVRITKPYWIGKTEVTQEQWWKVMGDRPSQFKGDELPVEQVDWDRCREFCKKLTERERQEGRLPPGYVYRLPTEAEWEYAARGGNQSKGYTYSGGNDIFAVAWYDKNSGNTTHPVGQKLANELGLYDMSGNVWESCLDDWHDTYAGAPSDGSCWGDGTGSTRVFRGGSWSLGNAACRSAARFWWGPSDSYSVLGFRVVLALQSLGIKDSKATETKAAIRNQLPANEISLCVTLVRNALYEAWDQPERNEAGALPAKLFIRLDKFGRISNYRITQSSGSPNFDMTVLKAAANCPVIRGLSAAFLKQHDELTVEFKLE